MSGMNKGDEYLKYIVMGKEFRTGSYSFFDSRVDAEVWAKSKAVSGVNPVMTVLSVVIRPVTVYKNQCVTENKLDDESKEYI